MLNIHTKSFSNRHFFHTTIVFSIAFIILLVKLFISSMTIGTNDIISWLKFAEYIYQHGSFSIYQNIELYNHPPLMSWILKLLFIIHNQSDFSFQFLFRLMPILSDFGSVIIIWKLMEHYDIQNRVWIGIFCAVNPINILVSGFHGNTDPIFIFLILTTVYYYETGKIKLSGTLFGLSLCVKIVPILLIPAFYVYIRDIKLRRKFFLSSLLIPLCVYTPYLIYDVISVFRNIFLYGSIPGRWGFGQIFLWLSQNEAIPVGLGVYFENLLYLHYQYGPLMIVAITIAIILRFNQCNLNLLEYVFLTLSCFLILTPGFGVQYLSWLSLVGILISLKWGGLYGIFGGLFLYRVYTYWSGGFPMNYANSLSVGVEKWVGIDKILILILWLIVCSMLFEFGRRNLFKKHKL